MEPIELTSNTIWKGFCGLRCPCGRRKRKHTAFCPACYSRLPGVLQRSLWRGFGDGFEEAYRVCITWFPSHPVVDEKKHDAEKERKRA